MHAMRAASLMVIPVFTLVGCVGGDPEPDPTTAGPVTVTIATDGRLTSLNGSSVTGDQATDHLVLSLTSAGFTTVDAMGAVEADPAIGTVEKISDSPLTVRYTLAGTARWSDGQPVTPADLLLEWVARSGQYGTVSPQLDATGAVTNQDELDAGVWFDVSELTLASAPALPTIEGASFTVQYASADAEWMSALDLNLPAHVVAERALGIDDPQEATQALVGAVTANDTAALAKVAQVWNSDFDVADGLPDEPLRLSTGPYVLSGLEDDAVTLTRNEQYEGDAAGLADTVEVRTGLASLDQVAALRDGTADLVAPVAAQDVVEALGDVDGVRTTVGTSPRSDRLALQLGGASVFDPASYGGDAAAALAVRQAFLSVVPRTELAEVAAAGVAETRTRDSYLVAPGTSGYVDVVAANGVGAAYGEPDAAGAQQLLAAAGVTDRVQVRVLLGPVSDRHTAQLARLTAAAQPAGFDVVAVDVATGDEATALADPAAYDAALLTDTDDGPVAEPSARYATGGASNVTGVSDPDLDALLTQYEATTDRAGRAVALRQVEARLTEIAVGVPVAQLPAVAAWDRDTLTGVQPFPLLAGVAHARWSWSLVDGS